MPAKNTTGKKRQKLPKKLSGEVLESAQCRFPPTKNRLIKASPMKVLTACMQWGKPRQQKLKALKSQIGLAIWGKNRRLRCSEILWGLLYDGAELEPDHAIVWQNLQKARRTFTKNSDMRQTAIRMIKKWQQRSEKAKEVQKQEEDKKGQQGSGGDCRTSGGLHCLPAEGARRRIRCKTKPENAPPAYRRRKRLTCKTKPEDAPDWYKKRNGRAKQKTKRKKQISIKRERNLVL